MQRVRFATVQVVDLDELRCNRGTEGDDVSFPPFVCACLPASHLLDARTNGKDGDSSVVGLRDEARPTLHRFLNLGPSHLKM